MFVFPEENNTGLPPIPFHQHSPLHTLKVTHISVKLNRMQCKQTGFVWRKKIICDLGKTDVRLSVWTQPCSITTISNTGVFNHNASTAQEPSRLKSTVKYKFQKVIFGEVHLGVSGGLVSRDYVKNLPLKYLLISKKISALAVQKIDFRGSIWESTVIDSKQNKNVFTRFCTVFNRQIRTKTN